MRVHELLIRDFRNLQEVRFHPDERLNFFLGSNGQGKTSILEALGFLATLQSFRGSKTPEVIAWGKPTAEILGVLGSDEWRTELRVAFDRQEGWLEGHANELSRAAGPSRARKQAFVNGKAFRSSTQYLSQRFGNFELGFHAVVFNPSDHDLVRGDPSVRRAFLDRAVAAEDVGYLKILQRYQRQLEQRNALLKEQSRPSKELLAGFSEAFAEYGAQLTRMRLEWIQRLSERLNDTLSQIAPNQPILRLVYLSNWVPHLECFSIQNKDLDRVNFTGQGSLPSLELLEQAFWKKLSELETAEWRAGHSLVGPHRDDWGFFFGGRLLKGHGSQGEVRSALLALKLSEIKLFQERTGHRPVFLLDDFSSELDRQRREFLFQFLAETDLQTFVSTTEDSPFVLRGKRFWVSGGAIVERQAQGEEESRPENLI